MFERKMGGCYAKSLLMSMLDVFSGFSLPRLQVHPLPDLFLVIGLRVVNPFQSIPWSIVIVLLCANLVEVPMSLLLPKS
ncbi:hypothetical protein C5167_051003 [Papaver somniferum]|uniref:Uncharacterized protein n=1 Tax=Papaver somniferum TaxID=3469 RepID=A0A4Y7KQB2_PAPSO|nr:hypothetical protein C5167_051003 [Papaver somniferum]